MARLMRMTIGVPIRPYWSRARRQLSRRYQTPETKKNYLNLHSPFFYFVFYVCQLQPLLFSSKPKEILVRNKRAHYSLCCAINNLNYSVRSLENVSTGRSQSLPGFAYLANFKGPGFIISVFFDKPKFQ